MTTYSYTVNVKNNNATYNVALQPYLDNGNYQIDVRESLSTPTGGVTLGQGSVIVNSATNSGQRINCTLQIKDTTNLNTIGYTGGIADGVLTSQNDDASASDNGTSITDRVTDDRINDLLARIVANWDGIVNHEPPAGGPAVEDTKNCPIKNIFLRITI